MEETLLKVDHVRKSFSGVKALQDVSFSIGRGETACLVGENGSGKSTMIKIISGVYAPDEGEIHINGRSYNRLTPITSIREGIHVIYQDFSLFPNLTVAENIASDHLMSDGRKIVNWHEVREIAATGLDKVKVSIPLDTLVESVSTANRQIIAIVKALLREARLIIMDEPTTALTEREIRYLFGIITDLKARGISVLFVSHKLNEIKQISEHTLIFRNGQKVLDERGGDLDVGTMELHMTGRKIDTGSVHLSEPDMGATPLLRAERLSVAGCFSDVSFDLRRGEVLGITGLLGSGRSEVALSLFGQLPADSGVIFLDGKEVQIRSIRTAVEHGIGYLPEDRIGEGLFLEQSISNNLVVRIIRTMVGKAGLLVEAAMKRVGDEWVKRLVIKTPTGDIPASNLSGGNQQRVVLGKWLASNPRVLILNAPTVGVDVGSKAELHELIRGLAQSGMGIILISDDVPELLQTCNRILLMRKGRIAEELERGSMTEEALNAKLVAEGGATASPTRPAEGGRGHGSRLPTMLKGLLRRETLVFTIIVVVALLAGSRNVAFLSGATLFDITRNSLPISIMALGVLLVLVSGGVDVSFVAIASLSSYATHVLLTHLGYGGGIALYFLIAAAIGSLIGFLEGFVISEFDLPVFNVSLAFMTLWYGFTLFFIGATNDFNMPHGLVSFYNTYLITVRSASGAVSGLQVSVIFVVVLAVAVWLVLRYTTFGRGLYAMGGNKEVAIRVGYNVKAITRGMFAIVGLLSAIAGVVEGALSSYFGPMLFNGRELDVIAAVIIGGASIWGGRGTAIGAVLGVVLLDEIQRALIYVGIPAVWQRFVTGVALIIFISIPAINERRSLRPRYVSSQPQEEPV